MTRGNLAESERTRILSGESASFSGAYGVAAGLDISNPTEEITALMSLISELGLLHFLQVVYHTVIVLGADVFSGKKVYLTNLVSS